MKNITATLSAALLLGAAQYCGAQTAAPATPPTTTTTKTTTAATAKPAATEWKEKDEFHKVIAQTFHPMEDGNYEPIRTRSGELAAKAVAWQKSTPPKELATEKVASVLRKLVEQTQVLDKLVQGKAADPALKEQLTKVHDTFHEIVGLCRPDGDDDHGHDGHKHDGHEGHDDKK